MHLGLWLEAGIIAEDQDAQLPHRPSFDVVDLRDPGGLTDSGSIENAVDGLNTLPTGLIDREVRLRMRIISEAS